MYTCECLAYIRWYHHTNNYTLHNRYNLPDNNTADISCRYNRYRNPYNSPISCSSYHCNTLKNNHCCTSNCHRYTNTQGIRLLQNASTLPLNHIDTPRRNNWSFCWYPYNWIYCNNRCCTTNRCKYNYKKDYHSLRNALGTPLNHIDTPEKNKSLSCL